jgi:hypothetical protein
MEFRRKKPYSNKTTRKRKPKPKSTKHTKPIFYSKKNKLQKGGGDIESGVFHVVTIAIMAHGCVTTNIPSNNYNIRYYNATGNKLVPHMQSKYHSLTIPFQINNSFRQDEPSGNGINEQKITSYFDTLPFDKIISVRSTDILSRLFDVYDNIIGFPHNGIWLNSVHKTAANENKFTYEYPEDKGLLINLSVIAGLNNFKDNYNPTMDLDKALNTPYVKKSSDNKRIEQIKLSYLLDLIKQIIGENCGLNVYDFSCSNNCGDSTETTTSIPCILQADINDIEPGYSKPFFTKPFGGNKKKKKKKKKTIFST